MRFLILTLIGFTIASLCGLDALAQKDERKAEKGPLKHSGKISREYDQDRNRTTLDLKMMPVTCVKEGCIFFNLRSSFSGKQPLAPANRYIFALYLFTKSTDPLRDSSLSFQMDGESLAVGQMTFAGNEENDGLVGSAYGVPLTNEEIGKIANSRTVEISMGSFRFTLDENLINAILDFHRQATVP